MARYAENTKVPVSRSRLELQQILKRYGARRLVTGEDEGRYSLQVEMKGRWYRFQVAMPPLSEFTLDAQGRKRHPDAILSAYEKEHRRRWRVLVLLLKAKLEMTADEGPETQDAELLPYLLMPDGATFAEAFAPQVEAMYEHGQVPSPLDRLLPAVTQGQE